MAFGPTRRSTPVQARSATGMNGMECITFDLVQ